MIQFIKFVSIDLIYMDIDYIDLGLVLSDQASFPPIIASVIFFFQGHDHELHAKVCF